MPTADDKAYVAAAAERCRQILTAGVKALLAPQALSPPLQRRRRAPGEIWTCYRCGPKGHVTTDPDHRPTWPGRMPLDNWPPTPACRELPPELDEFEDAAE